MALRLGSLALPYPTTPAGPTVLAADTFTRADGRGNVLTTEVGGQTWTIGGSNTWAIDGNRLRTDSGGGFGACTVDVGAADVTVNATGLIPVAAAATDHGLCGRVVDLANLIYLDVSWTGSSWLTRTFQRVSGTFSALTPLVGLGNDGDVLTLGVPFTLVLVLSGTGGEAFIDGVSYGTWSSIDATLVAPTRHGLMGSPPQAYWDNFEITT